MRFKYRIWHIERQRYVEDEDWYYLCDGGELWNIYSNFYEMEKHLCNPESYAIEQCTGFCDRNNKEIFEGDVVKDNVHGDTLVVYFSDKGEWRIKSITPSNNGLKHNISLHSRLGAVEIIGNIHDWGAKA